MLCFMVGSVLIIFLDFYVVFYGGVSVAHLFRFLCCVFCFVCLPPVSCAPNVACVSALPTLDCPFGFL